MDSATVTSSSDRTFHLRQVIEIIGDLQQRSGIIYWADFTFSSVAAWALCVLYVVAPAFSVIQMLAFLGASILFFMAGTFIHEIIHFQRDEMRWFRRAWNLLIGIPLLMPWIAYRNHLDHHSPRSYGTPEDGEYLPLATAPPTETVKYLLQAPLLPLFVVVRFGVLGPLSWLHDGLRNWVLTAASAAVSNPYYRKRFANEEKGSLTFVEILCFSYLAVIAVLFVVDVIDLVHVFKAYLLLSSTLSLNWIRTLAAHRYGNRGDRMTHMEQFGDSINIVGQTWLTIVMFPVGLRYHAPHHLVPTLPYHNLAKLINGSASSCRATRPTTRAATKASLG